MPDDWIGKPHSQKLATAANPGSTETFSHGEGGAFGE
jgi:hypothetical protein